MEIIKCSEQWTKSFWECLDFVAREEKYLLLLKAPPLEKVREFIKNNVANEVPQCFAIDNGKVVGWCDIKPFEPEANKHGGDLGMGMLPEYRRQGLGTKLVNFTMNWAKQVGLERVELEVYASNVPAINLYKKLGFVIEGQKLKARKLRGKYDDIVLMAKFL